MSFEYFATCHQKLHVASLHLQEALVQLSDVSAETAAHDGQLDATLSALLTMETAIQDLATLVHYVQKWKTLCIRHSQALCVHEWETDTIDLTEELSQRIYLCHLCGYTSVQRPATTATTTTTSSTT